MTFDAAPGMTFSLSSSSSVTRWLLVVVGCAVLETAQPTKAADTAETTQALEAPAEATPTDTIPTEAIPTETTSAATTPADTKRSGDTLLIPSGSTHPELETARPGSSSSWLVALALCAAGAAWFWWKKRMGTPLARGGRERQIEIEESRPLGNRQYLVVATVGERKFLLGVTPGSIQMLSSLDAQEEPAREAV